MSKSTNDRIKGLDGIRACAFLLVLAGHCGLKGIPNGFGVTVFFFLSGYLITTLLRSEWIRTGTISVSRFYIRRAFRILPPLYCAIALAVFALSSGILHAELQWKAVLAIQLFLTNFAELVHGLTIPLGLSPLWSLAVEEHFYLLFPVAYLVLLKSDLSRGQQGALLGTVCAVALMWRFVLMGHYHVFWNRVYIGTDTRLDSILFGAIMAIIANPAIDQFPALNRKWCSTAALVSVALLLATIAARGEFFRQTARYSIQGIALAPVFFYVARYSESWVTRWLEWKPLVTIGDLSYALYVFHYTVMFAVNTWVTTNPVATLVLTFAISCVLAELSRRFIERPAARLRSRILEKSRPAAIAEAVSTAS
ncbi:MAG: acyltransferase [Terracidiphilus sp.]|nr:acyltransferase [Terracidiphilus sp.]